MYDFGMDLYLELADCFYSFVMLLMLKHYGLVCFILDVNFGSEGKLASVVVL